MAVTDHGTLAGAWRFDTAARAAGLKPIIGEEVYWAIGSRRDHDSLLVPREFDDGADADGGDARAVMKTKTYEHLTLLARTAEGWSNLSRMATASADSFWSKPRMDFELLEQHRGGTDRALRLHRRPGRRPAAARRHRRRAGTADQDAGHRRPGELFRRADGPRHPRRDRDPLRACWTSPGTPGCGRSPPTTATTPAPTRPRPRPVAVRRAAGRHGQRPGPLAVHRLRLPHAPARRRCTGCSAAPNRPATPPC